MNKLETLKPALEGRNEEIMSYQINIDNYVRAIAKINAEKEIEIKKLEGSTIFYYLYLYSSY